jgi:cellulose synthase (UDP-forming)
VLILFLGYFQSVEAAKRPAPPRRQTWTVDVLIPTYNEPEPIVRRTVIGALAMTYPGKRVFVLDDARRPEIERLATSLGCGYITRPDNRHAKAGNLNHALALTRGDLIAIFDADHVPVQSFLGETVGFFEDSRVALVQTAQHFFNPDPFERNLGLTERIPPEQSFFYHVVQPGNDFWNSAFFCGSCAVLRRSAITAIGGFRTQTVTEDAHTSLALHARGFHSVYVRRPLAAGLATETLAAHVKQRMRWARGMAQVLRVDCPLFKRGLTVAQRLNYFNAMLHFFFGIPRLIMIAAPDQGRRAGGRRLYPAAHRAVDHRELDDRQAVSSFVLGERLRGVDRALHGRCDVPGPREPAARPIRRHRQRHDDRSDAVRLRHESDDAGPAGPVGGGTGLRLSGAALAVQHERR